MPTTDQNALSPVHRAMARKAAAGGIASTVPLGYRIAGYQSSARAEIDPAFFPVVALAFRLAADPAISLRHVLAEVRSAGAVGKRGGPLSLSTLQRILTNPFYAGLIRSPLTGKAIMGQHEPLVTREVFNKAQRNLRKRRCS